MSNEQKGPRSDKSTIQSMGPWLAVGITIGVALGAALDSMGTGIAIGIAIGVALGAIQSQRDKSK